MRPCGVALALLLSGCAATDKPGERASIELAVYTIQLPYGRLPLPVSSRGPREVAADLDGDRRLDTGILVREPLSNRVELWVQMGDGRVFTVSTGDPDLGATLQVAQGGDPTCPPHPTRTCSARPMPARHNRPLLVTGSDGSQHLWSWNEVGGFTREEVFP